MHFIIQYYSSEHRAYKLSFEEAINQHDPCQTAFSLYSIIKPCALHSTRSTSLSERVHTNNNSNPRQSRNVYGIAVSLACPRPLASRPVLASSSISPCSRPINRLNRHFPGDPLYSPPADRFWSSGLQSSTLFSTSIGLFPTILV